MPRGDKGRYIAKLRRQEKHIEQDYVDWGTSQDEEESRAWATVDRLDGGGKGGRSGSSIKKSSREGD